MARLITEFAQGLFIGAGGILPGISGASLAVVFGCYRELTALIAHPTQNVKPFLARHWCLALGIGVGFAATTLLLDRLFAAHERAIVYLFWGFIAGTIPSIWRGARKAGAGYREAISFALTVGAMIAFSLLAGHGLSVAPGDPAQASLTQASLTHGSATQIDATTGISPLAWVLSGAIVGAGSLLPGVSASFILVYLGLYGPLLDAAGKLDIPVLALVGAGALATIVALSRAIAALYERFHGIMAFGVLGFTLGSLVLVFPGLPAIPSGVPPLSPTALAAIASAAIPALSGLALSLFLGSRAD